MPPPLRPNHRRFWLALAPAMLLPFIAALFYFVLLTEHPVAKALYTGTKFFTVIWPLLALWLILQRPLPSVNFRLPKHRNAIPLGIATGLGIAALMFALMQTPLGQMAADSAPRIRVKVESLGVINHYWLFGLFISIPHSFIEEYYWRWFVFGHLQERFKPMPSHLIAAAAFTAHHLIIATQFFPLLWGLALGSCVGIGGLIWSLMFQNQQTLAGAWVSHLIVDVAMIATGHKILFGTYFG